jgi:uncharacterized membrane protein
MIGAEKTVENNNNGKRNYRLYIFMCVLYSILILAQIASWTRLALGNSFSSSVCQSSYTGAGTSNTTLLTGECDNKYACHSTYNDTYTEAADISVSFTSCEPIVNRVGLILITTSSSLAVLCCMLMWSIFSFEEKYQVVQQCHLFIVACLIIPWTTVMILSTAGEKQGANLLLASGILSLFVFLKITHFVQDPLDENFTDSDRKANDF